MRKVLALLAAVVSIFFLASCVHTHGVSNKNPVTLVGEWHQTNSNPHGWFTASISGESIQVDLHGRDSRSIFWMGSFDTSHRPTGKFKVVSIPDPDARSTMHHSLMMSNESKMTFTYNNGDLSFKFSAFGTSTIAHMSKTSTHIPTFIPVPKRTTKKIPGYNRPTAQTPKAKKPTIRTPKPAAPKVASPPKVSIRKK